MGKVNACVMHCSSMWRKYSENGLIFKRAVTAASTTTSAKFEVIVVEVTGRFDDDDDEVITCVMCVVVDVVKVKFYDE